MITRDKSAPHRLRRTADRIGRKELSQGGLQLGFRIGFSVRRKKESGFVGFAFNAAGKGRAIMQKKMPITLVVQRHRLSAIKQQLKIRRSAVLAAGCAWEKTQDEKRDAEDHRNEKVSPGNRRGS